MSCFQYIFTLLFHSACYNIKFKKSRCHSKPTILFISGLVLQKTDSAQPDALLAPEISEKIVSLLSDKCKQVQVASAITLFVLNRPTEKVIVTLYNHSSLSQSYFQIAKFQRALESKYLLEYCSESRKIFRKQIYSARALQKCWRVRGPLFFPVWYQNFACVVLL